MVCCSLPTKQELFLSKSVPIIATRQQFRRLPICELWEALTALSNALFHGTWTAVVLESSSCVRLKSKSGTYSQVIREFGTESTLLRSTLVAYEHELPYTVLTLLSVPRPTVSCRITFFISCLLLGVRHFVLHLFSPPDRVRLFPKYVR